MSDDPCPICGGSGPIMRRGVWGHFPHDHRPNLSGLDDGPYLPGCAPRKKATPKPPTEIARIRAAAWETRRAKYGSRGHRGSYSRGRP